MKTKTSESKKDSKKRILLAVTIGGSLEWYEIGIFIFWPLIIEGKVAGFDISLAESIDTAAISFIAALVISNGLARALGGWLFGNIGDKRSRKNAFSWTIIASAIPSAVLAILSFFISYHEWIAFSTYIYAVVKFFQGMPAGGELPGAICYLSETATGFKPKRFMCSFTLLGPQIGIGLSALICLAIKTFFSSEYIAQNWRYAFLISGLLGIYGIYIRKKMHETAEFLELKTHHKIAHKPLKILFSNHLKKLGQASVLSLLEVSAFSILGVIPYYFINAPYNVAPERILLITLAYSGLCAILMPTIGAISSKFISFPWLKTSVAGMICISPLLLYFLSNGNLVGSLIALFSLTFFLSVQAAILPSLLSEIFPPQIRYSGIAFSFNVMDGIMWAGLTGICSLLLKAGNLMFIYALPAVALTFLIGIRMCKKDSKLYSQLN